MFDEYFNDSSGCPLQGPWYQQPVEYSAYNRHSAYPARDPTVQCFVRGDYILPIQQEPYSCVRPSQERYPSVQPAQQCYPLVQPAQECYARVQPAQQSYPIQQPVEECYSSQAYDFLEQPRVQSYTIVPNLPCNKSSQPWDYNSMCFNVDGQACQYTNIVDLEDFMNNEKRKEKSKVAARCRRTKEMQIFSELTAALPARKEEVEQLDKASVMRLAISYLRVRDVVSLLPATAPAKPSLELPEALKDVSSEVSYMNALDGFVLVLSQQGDIVYCSENISEHLGVSQMEIMGQSVFEFSHPCDHDEVREALRGGAGGRRELLLRLKCTLTGKGRNVHLKSASYKVIRVTGHMLTPPEKTKKSQDKDKAEDKNSSALVAVGRPIPHPSNIEIPLDSKTFLSKHSLDMKFTYSDDSLLNALGYEPAELVGKSLYDFHHAGDSAALAQLFKSLFSKGQCETGRYRLLAKRGGYAWVQTQATVITDKQQKPVSVVCVNYVVSGIECKDEVFAAHQLQHAELKPAVSQPPLPARTPARIAVQLGTAPLVDIPNGAIVAILPQEEERPIPVTELIFAPRKKEMNKGYLMYSQEEGLTMLKDEPEDLTHLAPTAGDACIPLENNPFEMFDSFILSENYCSLLGDDLANGSPVDSLTDSLLLSSPEPQETDSSCEQSSLLTDLSLDDFDSLRSESERDDGKSPFIPLSDELPLLEPAVMWGALPDNVSLARPQPSEPQPTSTAPALQRLLAAPPTGPPPQDLITNIYSDQGLIPSRSVSTWDAGVKRVMKQVEEPCAKRAKRSPSPAPKSSSVLMNLLDVQQMQASVGPNYQLVMDAQRSSNPVIALSRTIKQPEQPPPTFIRTMVPKMSPLSLNVGQYSPGVSPGCSPVRRERPSPYSTQPWTPASKYMYSPGQKTLSPGILASDPYLTNKMQASPGFVPTPMETLLDPTLMSQADFWIDAEMMQGTDDLLKTLDDVKLV